MDLTLARADGTELDLPGDRARVPGALDDALGAGAGAQWEAFLAHAERVWDVTHGPFLSSPVSAAGTSVKHERASGPWFQKSWGRCRYVWLG